MANETVPRPDARAEIGRKLREETMGLLSQFGSDEAFPLREGKNEDGFEGRVVGWHKSEYGMHMDGCYVLGRSGLTFNAVRHEPGSGAINIAYPTPNVIRRVEEVGDTEYFQNATEIRRVNGGLKRSLQGAENR